MSKKKKKKNHGIRLQKDRRTIKLSLGYFNNISYSSEDYDKQLFCCCDKRIKRLYGFQIKILICNLDGK